MDSEDQIKIGEVVEQVFVNSISLETKELVYRLVVEAESKKNK